MAHQMDAVELRKQMAELHQQMVTLNQRDGFNAEDKTQYDAMKLAYDEKRSAMQRLEFLESEQRALNEKNILPQQSAVDATDLRAFKAKLEGSKNITADIRSQLDAVIRRFAGDTYGLSRYFAEARALTTTTNGVPNLINTLYTNELIKTMRDVGAMIGSVRNIKTSDGSPMDMDARNTAYQTGVWIAENTANAQQDFAYTNYTLNSYKFNSQSVFITTEALRDTQRDMASEIFDVFGTRLGNTLNAAITNGTGAGNPTGFMKSGVITNVVTGATGAATSVTYAKLKELIHAVKLSYRKGAKFICSDAMMMALFNVVDSQGRPLFTEGVNFGETANLLGYGIIVNEDMAAPAANAKSLAFFDPNMYVLRTVGEMYFDNIRDTTNDGYLYNAYASFDGKLIAPEASAVAVYAHSAT